MSISSASITAVTRDLAHGLWRLIGRRRSPSPRKPPEKGGLPMKTHTTHWSIDAELHVGSAAGCGSCRDDAGRARSVPEPSDPPGPYGHAQNPC
jgi:hypothetical protein